MTFHGSQEQDIKTVEWTGDNSKGDKECYHCGKFGHLMYSCPDQGEPKANFSCQSYLKRAYMLTGSSVQMLIDIGCTHTMVAVGYHNFF